MEKKSLFSGKSVNIGPESGQDNYIMAIESSCDETACAIVKNGREVISNIAGGKSSKEKKQTKKEIAKTIETLEQEMREAARNLDFERAMELRDIIFEMKSN